MNTSRKKSGETPVSSGFAFKKADLGKFATQNVDLALKAFAPGCRIMGLTRGNFSLIDLIHGVLRRTGPADVVITTWSAGIKDVHNVRWMLDSDLIRKFTLITDHSYKTRQKKYAASIEQLFGIENIRTSEIHAKFVLISNESHHVTIRTSMNLNANRTCESFELDEDYSIFEFYQDFVSFVEDNQSPGFVTSSAKVNKTLDLFFQNTLENRIAGWTEI